MAPTEETTKVEGSPSESVVGADATDPTGGVVDDGDNPLAPPDDFGAALLAEFQTREFGSGKAAMLNDDGTPAPEVDLSALGLSDDWAGGTSVDATKNLSPDTGHAAGESTAGAGDGGQSPQPPGDIADVPGGAPATTDPAPAAPLEPDPVAPVASTGFTWVEGDQSHTFSEDEVKQAISTQMWANNLHPDLRIMYGAIEQGTAVAINTQEYEQFRAWRDGQQTQQHAATRDADLAAMDLDPGVEAVIKGLRDQVDTLTGKAPTTSPQGYPQPVGNQQVSPSPYQQAAIDPNIDANLTATAQQMGEAVKQFAEDNHLSPEESLQLQNYANRSGVIPQISEQLAMYSPTGSLIRPANPADIANRALSFALIQHPELHTQVLARKSDPTRQATGNAAVNGNGQVANLPTTPAANAGVVAKKAKAASVATAPSAATPTTSKAPAAMTPQETTAAMAADIQAALERQN